MRFSFYYKLICLFSFLSFFLHFTINQSFAQNHEQLFNLEGFFVPKFIKKIELEDSSTSKPKQDLDSLYRQLRRTVDEGEAWIISKKIQVHWQNTGLKTLDLLLEASETAMLKGENAKALDFLDMLIGLKPDFSEAWCRRALIHMKNYDMPMAMSDLGQALEYNPKNFWALTLLGVVLEVTGHETLALKAYYQTLEIYPQMLFVQDRIMFLTEKNVLIKS